uniref:cAMP-dependent protein kinase inhibitor gamma n=1 Tax=Sphenodon punctatus TaxID=8508 RepID=A0A8D0HDV4_SPHPU
MMDIEPAYSNFISCDRSGRRNAVHDIQGDVTSIDLRKLAGSINELSIEGTGEYPVQAQGQDGTTPS